MQDKFEDATAEKDRKTNNDLQNTTPKSSSNPTKTGGEFRC